MLRKCIFKTFQQQFVLAHDVHSNVLCVWASVCCLCVCSVCVSACTCRCSSRSARSKFVSQFRNSLFNALHIEKVLLAQLLGHCSAYLSELWLLISSSCQMKAA